MGELEIEVLVEGIFFMSEPMAPTTAEQNLKNHISAKLPGVRPSDVQNEWDDLETLELVAENRVLSLEVGKH